MTFSPEMAMIVRDPAWMPHRYDPSYDALHYVRLTRDDHRKLTFLIDNELPDTAQRLVLERRSSTAAAKPNAGPLHFIFHSAYCCSTLLARAFDLPGISMGLKEPSILNDIAGWRRRGAPAEQVTDVLDGVLDALAQPFGTGENVVAKPSNIVNGIAEQILELRPATNALLLYAPLETYLRSVAKKGIWGRLWVREFFVALHADGKLDLGFADVDYMKQTDLQIAAVGWLAQHAIFHQLISKFGSSRVRSLDSETLLSRPHDALQGLFALFGLEEHSQRIDAIVTGGEFTRHSKFGTAFDRTAREEEHQRSASMHADEIAKVGAWAEKVAENAGIELNLPVPLIQ